MAVRLAGRCARWRRGAAGWPGSPLRPAPMPWRRPTAGCAMSRRAGWDGVHSGWIQGWLGTPTPCSGGARESSTKRSAWCSSTDCALSPTHGGYCNEGNVTFNHRVPTCQAKSDFQGRPGHRLQIGGTVCTFVKCLVVGMAERLRNIAQVTGTTGVEFINTRYERGKIGRF